MAASDCPFMSHYPRYCERSTGLVDVQEDRQKVEGMTPQGASAKGTFCLHVSAPQLLFTYNLTPLIVCFRLLALTYRKRPTATTPFQLSIKT